MADCRKPLARNCNETGQLIYVRCGQCTTCILRKKAIWTGRCYIEQLHHSESGLFITLTYSEAAYAQRGYHDVRSYLDRLRKIAPVRYYVVPDVGDRFQRFHWHMLIFNWDYSDKEALHAAQDKWWCGIADVRENAPERIGYTVGYITKKLGGISAGRPRMSNGIGKSFFLDQGKQLANLSHREFSYPRQVRIGKKRFPIDATCRKWLRKGFEDEGGVVPAHVDEKQYAGELEQFEHDLQQKRLGGEDGHQSDLIYHIQKAGIYGTAHRQKFINVTEDANPKPKTKRKPSAPPKRYIDDYPDEVSF